MANQNSLNNRPDANRTEKSIPVYGASGALTEIGPLTNGQLAIGDSGDPPSAASLDSAGGTITITPGAGTINLEQTNTLDVGDSGFLAYKNSDTSSATGDGSVATISANTEVFDTGNDYNTSTYNFTAPSTGKYYLGTSACGTNIAGSSATAHIINLTTSNRNYQFAYSGAAAIQNGALSMSHAVITDMDAADTAFGSVGYYGGSKLVILTGSAGIYTYLVGMLMA